MQPVAPNDLVDLPVGDHPGAVDAQVGVVAAGLDPVAAADRVAVAGFAEHRGVDLAGGDQLGADPRGQLGRGGVVPHDQQRPMPGEDVGEVAAHGVGGHLLLGAAADAAVRVVDGQHVRVAGAQPRRRLALPGVAEPVDLGQLDRVGVADQQLEQAAGADRAELGVVAGVDQFGAGRLDQTRRWCRVRRCRTCRPRRRRPGRRARSWSRTRPWASGRNRLRNWVLFSAVSPSSVRTLVAICEVATPSTRPPTWVSQTRLSAPMVRDLPAPAGPISTSPRRPDDRICATAARCSEVNPIACSSTRASSSTGPDSARAPPPIARATIADSVRSWVAVA